MNRIIDFRLLGTYLLQLKDFILKIEDELKQNRFRSNQHKAVVNVMFTNAWISDRFRYIFRDFQLTAQQYNVLRILRGAYPQAMNPNQIKAVIIDKNPDLTRLCDRLVALGYIARCIDPENKRKMNIRIVDKGLDILERIDPLMDELEKAIFGLDEMESQLLSDLLDKLRKH